MITGGLPSRGGESSVIMEAVPVAGLSVILLPAARLRDW